MSRAVTVGLGQRFKSQSKRISSRGEVCCRRSGLGGGSSANENVSPLVCFAIGGFLGSFWGQGAAVDYQFLVAAQVDGDYDPVGGVPRAFGSDIGSCAQFLRRLDAVTRVCFLVF